MTLNILLIIEKCKTNKTNNYFINCLPNLKILAQIIHKTQ